MTIFKMLIKYFFIFLFLFSSGHLVAAELVNLTTSQVNHKLSEKALVIDIRTPGEWKKTGIIPGSHPVKFFDKRGKFDADQWLAEVKKLQTSPDQEIILVCRSGGRSGKAGQYLTKKRGMSNISHLVGGMTAWVREKRATKDVCISTQDC